MKLKRLFILSIIYILLFSITAIGSNIEYPNISNESAIGSNAESPNISGESAIGSNAEYPNISAESAILIDVQRGQTLYSKNIDERVHVSIASKIMTAIITIESTPLDTMITASKSSSNTEGAQLKLLVGDKYSVENLLYAILLSNANDAAICLSEYISKSNQTFVDIMNEYALKLEMRNTQFTNSTGLYDEKQYTSATDLSKLLKYALSNESFNKIFATQVKTWFITNQTQLMVNSNKLFWQYDGVDGGKTGYNDPNLISIVTSATKGNQRLICILLNSSSEDYYPQSIDLFDYGFNNYRQSILANRNNIIKKVPINDTTISLVSKNNVYYTHPIGDYYIDNIDISLINERLELPIYSNTELGTVRYTLKDNTVINVSLFSKEDILPQKTKVDLLMERLKSNIEILYIALFLLAIVILMIIYKFVFFIIKKIKKQHN